MNIEYFGFIFGIGEWDDSCDNEDYWQVKELFPWFKNQLNLKNSGSEKFYLTINHMTGDFKLEQWENSAYDECSFSTKGKIKFQEPTIKQF